MVQFYDQIQAPRPAPPRPSPPRLPGSARRARRARVLRRTLCYIPRSRPGLFPSPSPASDGIESPMLPATPAAPLRRGCFSTA